MYSLSYSKIFPSGKQEKIRSNILERLFQNKVINVALTRALLMVDEHERERERVCTAQCVAAFLVLPLFILKGNNVPWWRGACSIYWIVTSHDREHATWRAYKRTWIAQPLSNGEL